VPSEIRRRSVFVETPIVSAAVASDTSLAVDRGAAFVATLRPVVVVRPLMVGLLAEH
jgi:hypothetical protein